MAKAPKRPCSYPGCPALVKHGRCDKHRTQDSKLDRQQYDRYQRNQDMKSYYNSPEWLTLRRYKLSINPLCEECEREGKVVIAYMVDHIKPIRDGGSRNDIDNLQSLCRPCSDAKNIRDGRFKKKNNRYAP